MFKFCLSIYILICFPASLLIFLISDEIYRIENVSDIVECHFLSRGRTKTSATFSVSNIKNSRNNNQVAAVSPHMDNSTRITSSEIGFIEEYGLLMNIVPSSILFDIHVSFKLYSSHVILSKLIPNEDQWDTKAFSYQRDVW